MATSPDFRRRRPPARTATLRTTTAGIATDETCRRTVSTQDPIAGNSRVAERLVLSSAVLGPSVGRTVDSLSPL